MRSCSIINDYQKPVNSHVIGIYCVLFRSPRVVVNWNDYFDSLIESFRQTIINSGNDPMTLPDVRDEFTVSNLTYICETIFQTVILVIHSYW